MNTFDLPSQDHFVRLIYGPTTFVEGSLLKEVLTTPNRGSLSTRD